MTELLHFLPNVLDIKETDLSVWILTLIDLSLAGNLLLIVIFSGYQNFVSKMEVGEHEDKPSWKGKVDFGGLKLKLVASIVAISEIQLLKTFMGYPSCHRTRGILASRPAPNLCGFGRATCADGLDRRQGSRSA